MIAAIALTVATITAPQTPGPGLEHAVWMASVTRWNAAVTWNTALEPKPVIPPKNRPVQAPQSPPTPKAGTGDPALEAIRRCESGGSYTAVSPGGTYRGAYQFDRSTWASVGGTGDPAAASPAEQDARAQTLYQRSGRSPWPVCGR